MGDDPTPYFACTLNDRFANLRRRCLASKEQYGTPIRPPSSVWRPQVATIQMRQFVNESPISGFRGNERRAAKLKVEPKLIRVQKMTRKWGSCSSNGTITIATDLMDQTSGFQDFVVAHELLHLRVPNHGRLFKALMTAHVPGWRSHDVRR
jgi:hypothetical protein